MSFKKKIIILGLIIAGAIAVVFSYYFIDFQIKKPLNNFGINKIFKINSGESVNKISENLFLSGIINHPFYFKFYLWKKNSGSSIKAGEYILNPAMNIAEITEIITKGEIINDEITILIPEGLTSEETENIFVANNLIEKGELIKAIKYENAKKYYLLYGFLSDKPENKSLEGYLFPDTYKFFKDSSSDAIMQKMLNNFDKKITIEMRKELIRQKRNIFETVILASIVQKEVKNFPDMKIVAGIFVNRLRVGQMLQADSTINFITGKKTPQALYADLTIDSPYNTYKFVGLPPGPISNPGQDAIRAVIWPEETPYFYFFSTVDGKIIYSKTYEEHLKNRYKFGV